MKRSDPDYWKYVSVITYAVVITILFVICVLAWRVDRTTLNLPPIAGQYEEVTAAIRGLCEIERIYAVASDAEKPAIKDRIAEATLWYERAVGEYHRRIAEQEANINDDCSDPASPLCQLAPGVPVRAWRIDGARMNHCQGDEWEWTD